LIDDILQSVLCSLLQGCYFVPYFSFLPLFLLLEFELRSWSLLGTHSAWVTPPHLIMLAVFQIGSCVFVPDRLRPGFSYVCSCVAGITGMGHHGQPLFFDNNIMWDLALVIFYCLFLCEVNYPEFLEGGWPRLLVQGKKRQWTGEQYMYT
jgi:hypothetical protein